MFIISLIIYVMFIISLILNIFFIIKLNKINKYFEILDKFIIDAINVFFKVEEIKKIKNIDKKTKGRVLFTNEVIKRINPKSCDDFVLKKSYLIASKIYNILSFLTKNTDSNSKCLCKK